MSMPEERSTLKPHLATVRPDVVGQQFSQRVRSLRLPQQPSGGSTGRWLLWTLCLLLAASTAVLGYLQYTQPQTPPPVKETSTTAGVPNGSSSVAPAAMASSDDFALESKGYIIPAHQILVSPKVNGMVVKLRITESQRVRKNDVLAELEDTEFRTDRDRAKANLAQAKARLERCQLDYSRAKDLFPKHAISHADFDMALGQRDEAAATVKLVEAELAKAQWRLDNCVIRADLRHDPQEERRGRQPRQSDRHARLLQPVRNGRPFRPGSGSDDPGARREQDFQGSEVQGPGRGLSRPRLRRIRVAADAHRRSGQRSDPGPRQGGGARRGRRSLSETGDGGAGVVLEEGVRGQGPGAREWQSQLTSSPRPSVFDP